MTEKIRIPIVVEGFGIVETQLDTVAKKLDQVGQSAKRTNESVGSSATSNAIRNASFQISDFVVQVQGGTAASRALGMQLPQLLAGFGTLGAVAGIVAGFAPQIIELFKSGDEAKPFTDAMKDLDTAIGDVATATKTFDMKPMYEEFNKANAKVRESIVELMRYKQALAEVAAGKAEASLSRQLGDMGAFGIMDKLAGAYGSDKASGIAKDLGIELSTAASLLGDIRTGTAESAILADKYALALAKGNDKGRQLAATLIEAAKGARDAASAQTAISEALGKMAKAGADGTIKVDKDKKHVETPLEKLKFEARAADAGIAPQTLKEIDALNEGLAKRNIGMTEYLRLAGVAMANDPVIAKNAKAVADQLKEEAQAQALLNDYRANNAVILERIEREAELAAMSDRQRLIAEAMYRAEDEARKLRERIIQQVKDEAAQKQALAGVEAELADQKIRVADAAARSFDQQRSFEFGWRKAFQAYQDNAGNAAKSAQEVFQQASSAMEDALTRFAMTGKISFSSLANSIIADIVRMQARAATSSIMGSLSGLLGNFFGGDSSSTGLASLPASVNGSFPANHSGGIVGTEATFYRSVPRAAFDNAPKYHTGGIASDEVPSILKRGEGVFTPAQMRALAPVGGNTPPVSVNVTVVGDAKVKQTERTDGRGGKIIDILIEQVEARLAGNISTGNGPVPAALQASYGINRTAGAY
jgi:lambda family phage tail tape measure protein